MGSPGAAPCGGVGPGPSPRTPRSLPAGGRRPGPARPAPALRVRGCFYPPWPSLISPRPAAGRGGRGDNPPAGLGRCCPEEPGGISFSPRGTAQQRGRRELGVRGSIPWSCQNIPCVLRDPALPSHLRHHHHPSPRGSGWDVVARVRCPKVPCWVPRDAARAPCPLPLAAVLGVAGDGTKSRTHRWHRGLNAGCCQGKSSLAVLFQECGKSWFCEAVSGEVEVACQEKVLFPEHGGALGRFPREWSRPRGCQSSRNFWTALPGWDYRGLCAGPGAGLEDPRGSLPAEIIPWKALRLEQQHQNV